MTDNLLTIKQEVINWRRYFHQHPEPSLKEYLTSAKIKEVLEQLNIPYEMVGETGILATIKGQIGSGKTILLRADIDALELADETKTSYQSKHPGLNHACGHDGHIAALLGAAKLLNQQKAHIQGTIKLAFQQAEEIGAGARLFVQDGHLYDVDEVFGIHLDSSIPVGKIAASPGANSASCDIFKVRVSGLSAHAAQPHLGRDALLSAANMVVELQRIVAREIDPLDSVVVAIGVLNAGTRYNIVANEAFFEGTVRAFSHKIRKQTLDSIKRIISSLAIAHQTTVDIDIYDAAAPLINDEKSAHLAAIVANKIVGDKNVLTKPSLKLGADDFADFLALVPGIFCRVGTRNEENPKTYFPHHHEQFDIDEDSLLIAVELYHNYALTYLKN